MAELLLAYSWTQRTQKARRKIIFSVQSGDGLPVLFQG
jgi:hypothetical protein